SGDDRIVKVLEEQKRDRERKEYEKKLKQKTDDEIAAKLKPLKQLLLKSGKDDDDDEIQIPIKGKSLYKALHPLEQPVRSRALSDSEIPVKKTQAKKAL